jgi:hypothetical protein
MVRTIANLDQIKFLNEFVKIYGFKHIADFKTAISNKHLEYNDFLTQINNKIPELKKYFVISHFNLSRKQYKIESTSLALSVLKKALQLANINFEMFRKNNTHHLRLIPPNNIYIEYIQDMSNIQQNMSNIQQITNHPERGHPGQGSYDQITRQSIGRQGINSPSPGRYYQKETKDFTIKGMGDVRRINLRINNPISKIKLLNFPECKVSLMINGYTCYEINTRECDTFDLMINHGMPCLGTVYEIFDTIKMIALGDFAKRNPISSLLDCSRIDRIYLTYDCVLEKDEYVVEVDEIEYYNKEVDKRSLDVKTKQYKYYPNRTYELHLNHPTRWIQLSPELHGELLINGESYGLRTDGDNRIYLTDGKKFMKFNKSPHFPDKVKLDSLHFSYIDSLELVLDKKIDNTIISYGCYQQIYVLYDRATNVPVFSM